MLIFFWANSRLRLCEQAIYYARAEIQDHPNLQKKTDPQIRFYHNFYLHSGAAKFLVTWRWFHKHAFPLQPFNRWPRNNRPADQLSPPSRLLPGMFHQLRPKPASHSGQRSTTIRNRAVVQFQSTLATLSCSIHQWSWTVDIIYRYFIFIIVNQ